MSGRPIPNGNRTVADAQSPRPGAELQNQNAARGLFTFPDKIKVVGSRCIICQEGYNTGMKPEVPIALSGCGHVFGSVCISEWLHTAERIHGCPLCRRKLFDRVHENLVEVEDEFDQNAGDEGNDPPRPITPIDAPFGLSDLADELQVWEPFQHHQLVRNSLELDLQEEQQVHLRNNASLSFADDEGGRVANLTGAALRYFLGDYPSTEAVIDAVRRRHIVSYEMIVEDVVDDHCHLFTRNPDQPPSYSEQTRLAFGFVQTAFRHAAKWLRGRPPHNDLHLRCLYVVLEQPLRERAADCRDYDIGRLTDLIKAGIFSSPRMEGPLDFRMSMSHCVPRDIDTLRTAEREPTPKGTAIPGSRAASMDWLPSTMATR